MSQEDNTSIGESQYRENGNPWNLIQAIGACHFRGSAMKYIARHRRRNGKTDLAKACHYLRKLSEWRNDHNISEFNEQAVKAWSSEYLSDDSDQYMMRVAAMYVPGPAAELIEQIAERVYPQKENGNES